MLDPPIAPAVLTPGYSYPYGLVASPPSANPVVTAAIGYISRYLAAARIVLSAGREIDTHPLIDLLERPEPHVRGDDLYPILVRDIIDTGNAYLVIDSDGSKLPQRLTYIPPSNISYRDGMYYVRGPAGGKPVSYPPDRMIHYRYGYDPTTGLGLPPLQAAAKDIWLDYDATIYASAMLRSAGMPKMVVQPGQGYSLDAKTAERLKDELTRRTTGEARGEVLILMDGSISIQPLPAQDIAKMAPRDMRSMATERICAILGIPPIVLGLDLRDSSTYANMETARLIAMESCIRPWLSMFASAAETLLPYYIVDPSGWHILYVVGDNMNRAGE